MKYIYMLLLAIAILYPVSLYLTPAVFIGGGDDTSK